MFFIPKCKLPALPPQNLVKFWESCFVNWEGLPQMDLHQFPIAVVRNCHEFSVLKQYKFNIYSWRSKVLK